MEREEESSAAALLPPASPQDNSSPPNRLSTLLGRVAGHRRSSMFVRETAALQLEERRANWAYSRAVVALDVAWNMAFAVVSVTVLGATTRERPNTPLRVWIAGYALQCVFHVLLVWAEYRRRRRQRSGGRRDVEDDGRAPPNSDNVDSEDDAGQGEARSRSRRITKRCESLNTMGSFLWWIIGIYWVASGGEYLQQYAPKLYWLTVVFLAFDVLFTIFCVALACVIGIALCCCLPCIITILYATADQEGASEADVSILPRYRYSESCEVGEKAVEEGVMIPLNGGGNFTSERVLLREDAECCICLTSYEDGVELHALPCNHHFHSSCIVKWLRMHATCPLCKYNILKGSDTV
ncbi:E3 ubiquitin-protein ligase [Canna indica]|uniref:RING-type E3 ubiquitin transferase n=1 Tax=Canna indica TaxID=4628 RepID=A0AAQ3KFY5_9LILI|nr:E3 ubiquitin-protein ligase [Canna indica]